MRSMKDSRSEISINSISSLCAHCALPASLAQIIYYPVCSLSCLLRRTVPNTAVASAGPIDFRLSPTTRCPGSGNVRSHFCCSYLCWTAVLRIYRMQVATANRSIGCRVNDWLIDWLLEWFSDWLIDWLNEWIFYSFQTFSSLMSNVEATEPSL